MTSVLRYVGKDNITLLPSWTTPLKFVGCANVEQNDHHNEMLKKTTTNRKLARFYDPAHQHANCRNVRSIDGSR